MKSWEETIIYIRTQPEFNNLVEKAYFDENLPLNVERFKSSVEFSETLKLLVKYKKNCKTILDIGCGNGISSIAFCLKGYEVTAVEPDPSKTVGAGAIRNLIDFYNLKNITVHESFAENIGFKDETFDVVYVRQAMHHANNLDKFINECARVLKKDGVLLTIRDHVIFDEKDKTAFLDNHPLQKFYGGENAYKSNEYENAMTKSDLKILKIIKTFDNEINFFPISAKFVRKIIIKKRIAVFILKLFPFIVSKTTKEKIDNLLNEKIYFGRMYSYIARKQ